MYRAAALLMLIVLPAFAGGCASVSRERAPSLDAQAPWCGPGVRPTVYLKTVSDGVVTCRTFEEFHWASGEKVLGMDELFGPDAASRLPDPNFRAKLTAKLRAAGSQLGDEPGLITYCVAAIDPVVIVAVPVRSIPAVGNRLPYHPIVVWCSPTEGIGPVDAERTGEDQRRIPVNWGWLVLDHVGHEWLIGTRAMDELK